MTLGNFCLPEKQSKASLEHNIPLYLDSLTNWLYHKKPNQIESFVYYLEGAFDRAYNLGLMLQEHFIKWEKEYYTLRKKAREHIQIPNDLAFAPYV